MRLHLWTAASNRPIVHPPGDIWVWRTWWNDNVDKGKTTDSTTSDIWQQAEGMGERDENLALHNISVHTCKWYFTCCKILWHGASGFIPLQRKACCGFLSPLKIHRLGRVWTREPWVQWQTHQQGDYLMSIHPMTLQPKLGLGLLYLLPPQCSIISGQHPVAPHLLIFSWAFQLILLLQT
jgi:hypothetical protein